MALPKNIPELIKGLHTVYEESQDENREDRIRSLELGIEEQRRDYEVFHRLYDQAKVKNFTFLTAGLALLAFLYGNPPDNAKTLADKLFIPDEPYGIVIYFLSLTIFLIAIGVLLFALKPLLWSTAYDNDQEDCVTSDYEKYLKYMKKRYLRSSRINLKSYNKKRVLLDMSLIPLLVGGILLVLLRFGG